MCEEPYLVYKKPLLLLLFPIHYLLLLLFIYLFIYLFIIIIIIM